MINRQAQNQARLQSEAPSSLSEARILTPAIVVLLGSTSAIAAQELMQHMLSLKPFDQRRVAFVYIDTDDPPTTLAEFRRQHVGVFQEFALRIAVPVGISRVERVPQGPQDREKALGDLQEPYTFIEGKEPQYFANGAGGIRNNGHVAACFNYQHIYDALDRALISVVRLDNSERGKTTQEVQVDIVSFLGGGTGSGILPDITVIMRDLLSNYQYKQRINLFCMLPEPIRGASMADLSWRKSNATACLLELLALSGAAGATSSGNYIKYMRSKVHHLTNDPVANEIYLLGHASMDDASSTARIVGLDLFQRITDASGVGFLEHSKWVDRRTLGETDDRGLPTMFGTSCPMEVRFPAEETAAAFAEISAAQLLPHLASYQPSQLKTGEADKREWTREWRNIARVDANTNDPRTVTVASFQRSEFDEAEQSRLDHLWARLDRFERETDGKIALIIDQKHKEELNRISSAPSQAADTEDVSVINSRIQHLQHLQQEYTFALDLLRDKDIPRVPGRPNDLEADFTQPPKGMARLLRPSNWTRDYADEVYAAYNYRLRAHAEATRYRKIEQLLKDLLQNVHESLSVSLSWFQSAEIDEHIQELDEQGKTSMAWQGRLDYPHPDQRHIFDLATLRSTDGRNLAVERLYDWATGGDKTLVEGLPIEYGVFVTRCVDYLTRKATTTARSGSNASGRLEDHSAGRLADRVVDFFKDYYREQFQDVNLFALLEKAAPTSPRGQSRTRQIGSYLLDHLQHIRGLMRSLVAFEAELWHKGLTTLDTSIYLGMDWRDGYQREILQDALDQLGSLTPHGQMPMCESMIDPHRLQVVYGQHALSLTTIRDFYLDQNSAMETYTYHQNKWRGARGSKLFGLMPVHSSTEAQRLVCDPGALGYGQPLSERIIRQPFTRNTLESNSDDTVKRR